MPLTILVQLIPRQQPRSYSNSSSALLHPGKVHLTQAAILIQRQYRGKWLAKCSAFNAIDTVKHWRFSKFIEDIEDE
ncbi:hypothetical protein V7S43_013355 [Phytophthora oleae]|uniref:DDE-1 domain-containing protein n=1 Tax=Phytophthora oleae TaxID=2107226 RepID=A0ABD3F6F0_9STRA